MTGVAPAPVAFARCPRGGRGAAACLRLGQVLALTTVALVAVVARSAAPPQPTTPVTYRLAPFQQTDPALAAAWEALHGGDTAALARSREVLAAWLAGPPLQAPSGAQGPDRDPLDEPFARLLLARVLDRLGDPAGAHQARATLLTAPGSMGDVARRDEAADLRETPNSDPNRDDIARLLWRVSSAVASHSQVARRAVALGKAQGRWEATARSLEGFLQQPLDARVRRQLTLTLAALWAQASKHTSTHRARLADLRRAERALRVLWWRSPADDTAAPRALRGMGRALSYGDQVAKLVLQAPVRARRDVRVAWRAVRTLRARTPQDRRIRRWARLALDARLSRGEGPLAKPIRRLEQLSRRLRSGPFGSYYHFFQASLLRRAGRDDDAITHYDALVRQAPEHVLAARARREAAGLTVYLGRPAEAAARWEDVARASPRGPSHRLGLWHAGFEAWAMGDRERAASYLGALRDAYGGEQDATGLSWAARAEYWLGRVAEDAGDSGLAARWFAHTAVRFPASYYALLARQRLAALAVPPPPGGRGGDLAVARCQDLDWTVALWRLGEVGAARRAADNLLRVGRLPGSGRALLARMVEDTGQPERAARLLRRGGVVAAVPSPGADDVVVRALRRAFALPYRAELQAAAEDNGLPLALLAGLVHVESRFNPKARSAPGAVGLTQVMPRTARSVGKHLLGRDIKRRALRDPKTNLAVGARLLRELLEHFGGNAALAVAAYNAGHGAVRGWLRSRGHLGTDAFVEAIPYGQARNYVRRVLSVAEIYRRLYTPAAPALYLPPSLPLTLGPFFEEANK